MVYLGSYIMDNCNDIFTVITNSILSDLDAHYLLLIGDEVIYYQVDVIPTGRYTTMSILFYGTFVLKLVTYKLCYQNKLFIRCRQ